jgi:hypothetical protein
MAPVEHTRGRIEKTMWWPDLGEEPAVETSILEDDTTAKTAAELWARRTESKAESGTCTWWINGSRADDARV